MQRSNIKYTAEVESDVEEIERSFPIPGDRPKYPREDFRLASLSPHDSSSDMYSDSSETVSLESCVHINEGEEESREEVEQAMHNSHPPIAPSRQTQSSSPEPKDDGRVRHENSIPRWFSRKIKRMFEVDRNGGALKFKELDQITMYRTALERVKRRQWKQYIKSGRKRWQFQKFLRKNRQHRSTMPIFYKFQRSQHEKWREQAFEDWKMLEKLHLGVRVLDEVIHFNFRQERLIYEGRLGGRFYG